MNRRWAPADDDTTTALFILDALARMTDEALRAAADDLGNQLTRLGSEVRAVRRLIDSTTPRKETEQQA